MDKFPRLNRRKLIQAVLCGTACMSLPIQAFAHRQKRALSSVEWNITSNTLEVIHTLHLHDAEQALDRIGVLKTPDLSSLRSRAQLALYSQKLFKLSSHEGEDIELTIIGAEIDSSFAYIYQEVQLSSAPKSLMIENKLLQDIYLDQTNLVNVTLGTSLKTLTFSATDQKQEVSA